MAQDISSGAGLVALCLLAATAAAQGVQWLAVPGQQPLPRQTSMAYDAARQRVVLFGGDDGGFVRYGPFQDTWEWDGSAWTLRAPLHSPPAGLYQLVYVGTRQRVLAFDQVRVASPWEWDGTDWTALGAGHVPPRTGWLLYDSSRQRVVLLGGYPLETWEWDGTTWSLRSTTGPTNSNAAYDPVRQVIVVIQQFPLQTWEWNGTSWSAGPLATNLMAGRGYSLLYDAARNRMMVYGVGVNGSSPCTGGETWEWQGNDWHQLLPTAGAPVPRAGPALAYDAAHGQWLMFGGLVHPYLGSYVGDTWQLASVAPASFTTYGSGCPGSLGDLLLAVAPFSRPWIGDQFVVQLGNLPAGSLAVMVLGFAPMATPIPALPGCVQLHSAEAIEVLASSGSDATWTKTVPINGALIGWSLFLQGAAINAGGNNPLGAALSPGGEARIGMR